MRSATRTMSANLRWTRSGTVWADWVLTGLPYGLRPLKDKETARSLHQALIRSLPGESLLLGICSGLDPAAVVERMLEGVDLAECPDWVAECEATLDTLDEIGPGQRIYWLSVPLGFDKQSDRGLEPLKASAASLRDQLGLPRAPLSQADLERRLGQASRIAEGIPGPFHPRPATPAQMVWLHEHSLRRGLFQDLDLPTGSQTDLGATLLTPKSSSALSEPILDEGGQTDLVDAKGRGNPLARRFLKVIDGARVAEAPASYQSLMVISDVPDAGMAFPGGEVIGRVDESGLNVDWAMRLNVRSSSEVASKNQRALKNLNEQYGQRSGELSHGLNVLDRAADDLAEYVGILSSDKLEVEAQATLLFCVAGPDQDSARLQAQDLATFMSDAGYKIVQPLGLQEELWWAMQPGVPPTRAVREFAQITTSKALSTLVPLASVEVGDSKGSMLGLNIGYGPLFAKNRTCGTTSVILHDIDGATSRDVSGSLAIAGELGSGKSVTLKKLAGDIIDRGGRIIVADRTAMGEYAVWARSVTSAVVVDIAAPELSLDPLRLFGPTTGARIAQSFLTPLLNVAPTSPRGVLLSDVLDPSYLDVHDVASLGGLVTHLLEGCDLEGAQELARLIRVFSRKDLGRVIFDETVPPLSLSSAAVIIRTHTLRLPSRDELEHQHLFEQLGLEKIFGRAMYALIAAIARTVSFDDLDRLAGFVVDEAHAVMISPEAEREIADFIRDGRKHHAAVLLGSHDPLADFGSPTMRQLIPTRILMRHRDKDLAANSLKWLGLDPTDQDLLDLVCTNMSPVSPGEGVPPHRRGECLIRDTSGNVGRGKVLVPSVRERGLAVMTSGPTGGSPIAEASS